jgi:hypothetical protein
MLLLFAFAAHQPPDFQRRHTTTPISTFNGLTSTADAKPNPNDVFLIGSRRLLALALAGLLQRLMVHRDDRGCFDDYRPRARRGEAGAIGGDVLNGVGQVPAIDVERLPSKLYGWP